MTNEEISKLSDEELRLNLVLRLIPKQAYKWYKAYLKVGYGDYLNNWNHLMPLVVEYGIAYVVDTCQIHVKSYFYPKIKVSKGLHKFQRALAECLLQVLIAKKEGG